MTNSNTNEDSTPQPGVSAVAELASAFGAKDAAQQDPAQTQDQQGQELGTPAPGSSPERTPSSSTAVAPSREEIIAGLTLDELRAHPTLGGQLQSYAQSEAANQLRGKTESIRRQVQLEVAQREFSKLSKEDLGELLANDDEAAVMYAELRQAPPPPPTTQQVADPAAEAVRFFTTGITTTKAMITGSDLSEPDKLALAPERHLMAADHPGKTAEEIYAAWQLKVTNAITDHRIKSATAGLSASVDLERQAREDESKPGGALMSAGTNTTPKPDFDSNSGRSLLASAMSQSRPTSRSK